MAQTSARISLSAFGGGFDEKRRLGFGDIAWHFLGHELCFCRAASCLSWPLHDGYLRVAIITIGLFVLDERIVNKILKLNRNINKL